MNRFLLKKTVLGTFRDSIQTFADKCLDRTYSL